MKAPYDFYNYQAYWDDRDFEDCCERICLKDWLAKVKSDSLVDIGGGFGRLSELYSPFFKKCLVVDPSEKLLQMASELKGKIANLQFKKGGLPGLPLKDASFDVALVVRVSHHLPELYPSLKEINRILKADGYLILEVANKIHFLARIRAWVKGDFSYTKDFRPVERGNEKKKKDQIAFLNHHPQKVIQDLAKAGFRILEVSSVSNLRNSLIKKIFPRTWLLRAEGKLQKPLARFFFGPSVFFLAQKSY